MKISFQFKFIRDYLDIRRRVFTNAANQIGVLEWLIGNGNGLRNDNGRAIIKGTIWTCKSFSFKTKSQKETYHKLEDLYNKAIEVYEKKRTEFLSKA